MINILPSPEFCVGFTGTRVGMTSEQGQTVRELLKDLRPAFAIHGACVGADRDFDDIAASLGIARGIFPSNIPELVADLATPPPHILHDPAPPLVRNPWIPANARTMIAAPKGPEVKRSGTWHTVRVARRMERTIYIVHRDGSLVVNRPQGQRRKS